MKKAISESVWQILISPIKRLFPMDWTSLSFVLYICLWSLGTLIYVACYDLFAVCNSLWNLYGLPRGFFINKVCSFTFLYQSISYYQLVIMIKKNIYSVLKNLILPVVRTFLSVLLRGRSLSFDWNLLLFLLLLSGLFVFFFFSSVLWVYYSMKK